MVEELKSRSFFVTVPVEKLPNDVKNLKPEEVLIYLEQQWIVNGKNRVFGGAYCISEKGYKHCHIVLESSSLSRVSAVQKAFPNCHREITKGSKEDVIDYIEKNGKFEEKGEKVLSVLIDKDKIKGKQGKRSDLDDIVEMINKGMTPREIFLSDMKYLNKETFVKKCYYLKRLEETPEIRSINVFWHVGESGTGKSYSYVTLGNEIGFDNIFRVGEYGNGFMDNYGGEPVLYLDEFRGNLKYSELLTMLDCYKTEIHARYNNVHALYTEVHITSVYAPEQLYTEMLSNATDKNIDTFEQLKRRLTSVIYHWKKDKEYLQYEISSDEYVNISQLKKQIFDIPNDVTSAPGLIPFSL